MVDDEKRVTVGFSQNEYERLCEVTDDPAALVHESAMRRIQLEKSIEFTMNEGFRGEEGLRSLVGEVPPPPVGALVGFEVVSLDGGESQLVMETGPEHANPMGTLHGGVICDIGDAAMGSAYASTLEPNESFTTLELGVNYLRPVWNERLEAHGRVVSKGNTVGLVECDVTNAEDDLVARLNSTCLTLRGEQAADR